MSTTTNPSSVNQKEQRKSFVVSPLIRVGTNQRYSSNTILSRRHRHMIDPYYEPHSRLILSKPIALIGFWGARVTEIAVAVSQMSGVPFLDVERNMEHRLGMSLQQFVIRNNPNEARKIEKDVIVDTLKGMHTPPIISLRPDSFQNEATRNYILTVCDTLYIRKNIFLLFSHLLDVLDRKERNRHFMLPVSDCRDINQVAQCLRDYESCYQFANRTVQVEREHPLKTASMLLKEVLL